MSERVGAAALAVGPRFTPEELRRLLGLRYEFSAEQQTVITAPADQPLLVVAGAGSGKTELMALRVMWLIANQYVRPDQVLGLTFTRKAAGELSHRIRLYLARSLRRLGRDPQLIGEPTVVDVPLLCRTDRPRARSARGDRAVGAPAHRGGLLADRGRGRAPARQSRHALLPVERGKRHRGRARPLRRTGRASVRPRADRGGHGRSGAPGRHPFGAAGLCGSGEVGRPPAGSPRSAPARAGVRARANATSMAWTSAISFATPLSSRVSIPR